MARSRRPFTSRPERRYDLALERSIHVPKLPLFIVYPPKVAIKITDKMHAPIVEREIETWRRLRHPYIAQLYEVIIGESKIYMVTELARGGELFDYVRDHSPLEGAEAKRIFRQLLLAMQHCHDKNFVHR